MNTEITSKTCTKCGRELPIANFYKKTNSPDGYQQWCHDCMKENYHKNRQEERAKVKNDGLAQYTPRELMVELKKRGYDGELIYTKRIKLSNL